jgi:hypothetical protein
VPFSFAEKYAITFCREILKYKIHESEFSEANFSVWKKEVWRKALGTL